MVSALSLSLRDKEREWEKREIELDNNGFKKEENAWLCLHKASLEGP